MGGDLSAGIVALRKGLKEGVRLGAAVDDAQQTDPCLLAAGRQLLAVLNFLTVAGVEPHERAPLGDLLGWLADIERGVSNPHLKPRRKAKTNALGPAFYRALDAAHMTVLMDRAREGERRSEDEAAREVAGAGAEALKRYRDRLMRDDLLRPVADRRRAVTERVAAEIYRQTLKDVGGLPRKEAVETIVAARQRRALSQKL